MCIDVYWFCVGFHSPMCCYFVWIHAHINIINYVYVSQIWTKNKNKKINNIQFTQYTSMICETKHTYLHTYLLFFVFVVLLYLNEYIKNLVHWRILFQHVQYVWYVSGIPSTNWIWNIYGYLSWIRKSFEFVLILERLTILK